MRRSIIAPHARAMQSLADDGLSLREIGERFGFAPSSLRPYVRTKRRRVFRPDVTPAQVRAAVSAGASEAQAAKRFGCSRFLIRLRLGRSINLPSRLRRAVRRG
jgi:transposase